MASYTVLCAKHATLVASTVDTVTINQPASFFLVSNRAVSGAPIYFTVGDTLATTATPTVEGDDTYVIPIGITMAIPFDGTPSYCKLISADAQAYSVMVL
jgi:hypothetical protein